MIYLKQYMFLYNNENIRLFSVVYWVSLKINYFPSGAFNNMVRKKKLICQRLIFLHFLAEKNFFKDKKSSLSEEFIN